MFLFAGTFPLLYVGSEGCFLIKFPTSSSVHHFKNYSERLRIVVQFNSS